jgi:hypothetical protein
VDSKGTEASAITAFDRLQDCGGFTWKGEICPRN